MSLSPQVLQLHLGHVAVDLERSYKIFDLLRQTVPNSDFNPHWKTALLDLQNARTRVTNLQVASKIPDTVTEIKDLPQAAPPPEEIKT